MIKETFFRVANESGSLIAIIPMRSFNQLFGTAREAEARIARETQGTDECILHRKDGSVLRVTRANELVYG